MNELAGVEYYYSQDRQGIPYGYTDEPVNEGISSLASVYPIYKNINPLGFGYSYSNALSQEGYEKLSPIEKQDALRLRLDFTKLIPYEEGMQ